jgi:hypothetical protein
VKRSWANSDPRPTWSGEKHPERNSTAVPTALFREPHYSVADVSAMWNMSKDAARKIFQNEPGVLVLGSAGSKQKRRYTTLRIPESVLKRVHQRLQNV